jgi:hypothetical protein
MAFVKSGTGMFVPDGVAAGQRPQSEPFMQALIDMKARLVAKCLAIGTGGKIYPRIEGTVQLDGLNLVLLFRGAAEASRGEPIEREVSSTLIPSGLSIEFPRQSGKEAIVPETAWLRLEDAQCRMVMPEQSLASARHTAIGLESEVHLPAEVLAWFTAEGCGDPRGPFIQIRGDLRLPFGLRARFLTRANGDGLTAVADRAMDRDLIPSDRWIPLIERELSVGIGPRPSIWARLTDGRGAPHGPPRFLGRCVPIEDLTRPRSFTARRVGRLGFGHLGRLGFGQK